MRRGRFTFLGPGGNSVGHMHVLCVRSQFERRDSLNMRVGSAGEPGA